MQSKQKQLLCVPGIAVLLLRFFGFRMGRYVSFLLISQFVVRCQVFWDDKKTGMGYS
jgi:hypothetical protein